MRAIVIVIVLAACSFQKSLGASGDDDAAPDAAIDASPDTSEPAVTACAQLALGSDHSCALRGGNVYCWGCNGFGERGGGSQTTPVPLPPTKHLASSKYTNCAVANDGSVRCWGNNDGGQLGRGAVGGASATPDVVMGMSGAVQAGVGRSHACARRMDGTIRCWGSNTSGQFGDSTTTSSSTAATDAKVMGMVDFSFTSSHVCAVDAAGAAKCWGDNGHGQLGDGTMVDQPTPIDAPLTGVTWIGTASYSLSTTDNGAHTCAIANGTVQCWGDNTRGQLGNGTTTDSAAPVSTGITDAVQVAMGRFHNCARRATGRVSCWGRNLYGEVGDGTTTTKTSPVDVGLTDVVEIGAGGFHTCAITASKAFYCWGLNQSGRLGIGAGATHLAPTLSFTLCP